MMATVSATPNGLVTILQHGYRLRLLTGGTSLNQFEAYNIRIHYSHHTYTQIQDISKIYPRVQGHALASIIREDFICTTARQKHALPRHRCLAIDPGQTCRGLVINLTAEVSGQNDHRPKSGPTDCKCELTLKKHNRGFFVASESAKTSHVQV